MSTNSNLFLNVEIYQYACEVNCLLVQRIEVASDFPHNTMVQLMQHAESHCFPPVLKRFLSQLIKLVFLLHYWLIIILIC